MTPHDQLGTGPTTESLSTSLSTAITNIACIAPPRHRSLINQHREHIHRQICDAFLLEHVGFREHHRLVNGVAVSAQRIVKRRMRTVISARLNLQGQNITIIGLYQEIQFANSFFRKVIQIGESMRGKFLSHDILIDSPPMFIAA